MARVFEAERVVPAWADAVKYLDGHGRQGRNLLLEIASPLECTEADRATIAIVDKALRESSDLSVKTVANTIFPQSMYLRYGRPAFYDAFKTAMVRATKKGTWGTYALRIMERRAKDPAETINPLDQIVQKLIKATSDGNPYQANYELGVAEPFEDLDPPGQFGCELPTFNVARDGACVSNIPCLSHLSFKLTARRRVDLTAIYRSHYYAQRALGNLIGLSQLLGFVARESKLVTGILTCVSTHAVLDLASWGPAVTARGILQKL